VYFALLLLLEAATLGVFCALDTILFFFCWEFTLLPLYFLVSLWGVGAGRQAAAVRYFLVMLAGGVPLLFGLLAAGLRPCREKRRAGLRSADPAGDAAAGADAVRRVPAAAARFWRQGAAGAAAHLAARAGHGCAGGGDGAARRPQARRLRADPLRHPAGADRGARPALAARRFRHRGHPLRRRRGAGAEQSARRTGVREPGARRAGVLGLASFSVSALQGALLQLLNFSVAAGGGFLVLAFLQRRSGSTDISQLGGVMRSMPLLSGFFLLFGLAGIGLPGTSGFPGELLIIVAALHSHTGAGLAALFGMVLAAAGFLAPFRQAFLGPLRNPDVAAAEDLLPRELAVLLLPAC
jgi:NADH-quinone oxidoreductase subunit M